MKQIFTKHEFPELIRIDSEQGRCYQTPEGDIYPSVSTVCGYKTTKHIQEWRKRVGEAEANRISSRASQRGTEIHSLCEQYLTKGKANPSIFDQEMFNSLKPYLDQIDNIEALEQPVYSKLVQVAGTVDLVATLNGVPSIIDWKTSKRVKTKEEIYGYFCQAFFYGQSFFEHTGSRINQLVIIMGVDDHPPSIFIERAQDWRNNAMKLREEYRQATGL